MLVHQMQSFLGLLKRASEENFPEGGDNEKRSKTNSIKPQSIYNTIAVPCMKI